jgi:isopenicillin N synthase-like dioxygenase
MRRLLGQFFYSEKTVNKSQEHFDCGPAEDDQFPNRWPAAQHIPGFREFMESYYSTSQEISLKIIEACEVGLCLNPGTLVNQCMPTASELRLIHYPTVPTAKLKDGHTKRCWPHSDFGVISLLFQDNVGGLEIEDRANPGTFVPVLNGYPAEMVVNISDTFQRWSNDALKVGIHQVTTPGHMGGMGLDILPERFSAVFFCKAHRETLVGSLPAFVRPEKPAAYDNITALQFQRERTRKVY